MEKKIKDLGIKIAPPPPKLDLAEVNRFFAKLLGRKNIAKKDQAKIMADWKAEVMASARELFQAEDPPVDDAEVQRILKCLQENDPRKRRECIDNKCKTKK